METFVGDTIKIVLDTKIDISIYDVLQIKYKKPSGEMGHWDAIIGSTNLKMTYTTNHADLDEAGTWSIQACAYDVLNTAVLNGKWVNFEVLTPITA